MGIEGFHHKAIYGATTCGKTYFAKRRIDHYLKHKQQVVVFPGNFDRDWPRGVDYVDDVNELEAYIRDPKHWGAFVFVDEADLLFEDANSKKHPICENLTKRVRHFGCTAWLIAQYPISIPKKQRRGCLERFMFQMADHDDAVAIWKDCNKISYQGKPLCDWLMEIPKYSFFHYRHPDYLAFYPFKG